MTLVLRMLGSLEITVDGRAVHPGGPKQRALLCFLVLHAGQPVTNSALIEAVWGPDAPDGAIRSLRTYVSSLRRLLGSSADLIGDQGTYRLIPRSLETDVDRFSASVRGEPTPMQDERSIQLDEALALWRGPFLAGIDHPWVAAESARLEYERMRAVAAWSEIAIEDGRHNDAIAELTRAVSESPLDEQLSGLLMRAMSRAGRQSDALAVYRDIRGRLASDLGISPGAELQAIEERIVLGHESMGDNATPPGLPDPPTDLVGRSAEVEEILGHIGHTRLLTLTGPGGVGKTRLALEVGRRIVERGEGPVFFTDLSALFDSTAVEAILAASARVQPHPDSGPLASLIEYLRSRNALLIVDNCEHLMSTVAPALAALVRQCPAVTIIATSRAPLHVDGELEWRTPPLALPDRPEPSLEALRRWPAIELVFRRAPAGFRASSVHQADLVAMCRSVDGLPLALEIAASRLGAMTPADVTRTLESRRAVDALKPFDDRHGDALDATIAWSYELLPQGPRALLDRLGVMSGQFVFDDVFAVCGPPGAHADDVLAWLTMLVEHSLVLAETSDERTRYRLLETIRRFALSTLGADLEAVRHRHVEHYTALAEREAIRLLSRAEGEAVEELAMAHDNLRSAFRSSMETGDVGTASRIVSSLSDAAYWRSHIELSQWAELAWNAATSDDPSWNGVCGAAARGAWMGDRFDEALRFAGAASHLRPAPISQSGHADDVVADVALYRGDAESALAHYAAVASAAGECGDLTREVWATYYVAVTNAVLRRPAASRDAARRALEGASETGNPTAISFALYATGLAIKHRSPEEAIGLFTEAVRTAESVRNDWFAGIAGMELAATMMLRGDAVEGMEALVGVIDLWHRFGDHTQLRLAWRYLVRGLVQVGLSEEAAVLSGALLADELSVLTHPHPSVLTDLKALLGDATYTLLTVRGLVMSTSELVDASLAAIVRARSLSRGV